MSLKLPNLDTKTYKEISDEMVASIPKYTDKWTNHNPSDPGIIIIELLSWIAETTLYRINRVPDESYVNFLRLVAGASGAQDVDHLLKIPNLDKSHRIILEFLKEVEIEKKYLFNWDEIPGNDNVRLIDFLKQKFSADWVKTAKIEKIDNDKTIRVSTEKKSLLLKLNNEKTKLNIEIDGDRTDEFIAKTEDDKPNIYEKRNKKSIEEMKGTALRFLMSHYRAVTEEDFRQLAIESTSDETGIKTINAKVKRAIVYKSSNEEKVEIIIVSDIEDSYDDLIVRVKNYLNPRKLIGTKIEIKKPVYTDVSIDINVKCHHYAIPQKVEESIKDNILKHLDPFVGGDDQTGWPYKRPLSVYEVAHIIEETDGVKQSVHIIFDKKKEPIKVIDGLIKISSIDVKVEKEEG